MSSSATCLMLLVVLMGCFHGPAVHAYKLPTGHDRYAGVSSTQNADTATRTATGAFATTQPVVGGTQPATRPVIGTRPDVTGTLTGTGPVPTAQSDVTGTQPGARAATAPAAPVVYGELYREQLEKLGQQPGVSPRGGVYEDHTLTQLVTRTPTVTETVTKTHTLRLPSTSDVWVTSLKTEILPVTQLLTSWNYKPALPETVTSFIRVTQTKFVPSTVTVETFPTKTLVSVYTHFVTSTTKVDYWQPIVHYSTKYEHVTRPVLESQTLLQRLFTTTTLVDYRDVTTTRRFQGW